MASATDTLVLQPTITSPQGAAYDIFGSDLCLNSPSMMCVGIRGADQQALNAGAVECFQLGADGWGFAQRMMPNDLVVGDQFGESVSGNIAWLGAGAARHDAAGSDAGAVWIYKNRPAIGWSFTQKLLPPSGSTGARFGSSIAVGETIMAVGAPRAAGGGFVALYALSGEAWVAEAPKPNPVPAAVGRFGESVSISGDWLAIGDPLADNGNTDAGAVYVYQRVSKRWTGPQILRPLPVGDRLYFGQSVSISGTRMVVGAYGYSASASTPGSGRVELFELEGTQWRRSSTVEPEIPAPNANFGWDVAIDGDLLAVGEPGSGSPEFAGSTAFFHRKSDRSWDRVARLTLNNPDLQPIFGSCVAMNAGQVATGAPGASAASIPYGAVAVVDLGTDCNGNQLPDIIDIQRGAPDCDENGVPDSCQVDSDGDGIPNACECAPDLNHNGWVSAADLVMLLNAWGLLGNRPEDLTGNGTVDAADVSTLLSKWGECE